MSNPYVGHGRGAHRRVVEQTYGPLPRGAVVHHADGNPANNAPGNLVLCPSGAYHKLLHMRMRGRAATGNPAARLCAYCHQYDLPSNMSGEASGRFVHPACNAQAHAKIRAKRQGHGG